MKSQLEDLIAGIPARDSEKGKGRTSGSTLRTKTSGPETALDKTTTAAWGILDEEAEVRAEKTARLKAARQARDGTQGGKTD
jgi:hypothetical protein